VASSAKHPGLYPLIFADQSAENRLPPRLRHMRMATTPTIGQMTTQGRSVTVARHAIDHDR